MTAPAQAHIVVVGGGFAGVGHARELAKGKDLRVNLIVLERLA